MKQFWLLLFLCFSFCCRAQMPNQYNIILDAEKLLRAHEVLMKNPMALNSQLHYLKMFPNTKDKFMAIFDPDDKKELYGVSNEYIETFKNIGANFPDSVLRIGLAIGKQMEWSSGASEDLQHAILEVAVAHPYEFVQEIYRLKKKEMEWAVRYLADVEQNPKCALYNDLVAKLQKTEMYNLAGKLTRAKGTSH